MTCPGCGSTVGDSASFCPNCGCAFSSQGRAIARSAAVPAQSEYDPVGARHATRRAEMNELSRMIDHFSKKSERYREYDSLCEQLDPRLRQGKGGLLAWGIVLAFLSSIIIGIAFDASNEGETTGIISFGIISFIGSAAMIFGYVLSARAREANYKKTLARLDTVTNELYSHYRSYGPCLVSAEYTNPSNLMAIYGAIQSGRADTIKEAVNMLLEDAHRYNMQAFARQTAIASANAARGARAAAIFSAANFFLR